MNGIKRYRTLIWIIGLSIFLISYVGTILALVSNVNFPFHFVSDIGLIIIFLNSILQLVTSTNKYFYLSIMSFTISVFLSINHFSYADYLFFLALFLLIIHYLFRKASKTLQ